VPLHTHSQRIDDFTAVVVGFVRGDTGYLHALIRRALAGH
jgi:hypothetical protein